MPRSSTCRSASGVANPNSRTQGPPRRSALRGRNGSVQCSWMNRICSIASGSLSANARTLDPTGSPSRPQMVSGLAPAPGEPGCVDPSDLIDAPVRGGTRDTGLSLTRVLRQRTWWIHDLLRMIVENVFLPGELAESRSQDRPLNTEPDAQEVMFLEASSPRKVLCCWRSVGHWLDSSITSVYGILSRHPQSGL